MFLGNLNGMVDTLVWIKRFFRIEAFKINQILFMMEGL